MMGVLAGFESVVISCVLTRNCFSVKILIYWFYNKNMNMEYNFGISHVWPYWKDDTIYLKLIFAPLDMNSCHLFIYLFIV